MTSVAPHPKEFIACARREFRYLQNDFGCVEFPNTKRRYHNPVSVRYENQTTIIIEGIEHGFSTSVKLGTIPQPSGDLDDTFPLWPLAQYRQSELYNTYRQSLGQLNQLPLLATLLRLTAQDIVTGDFTMVPYIKQTVEKYVTEQRRLEADRELQKTVQKASDAFWGKRYNEVVNLLAPHENCLTPAQSKQLQYARNNRRQNTDAG